VRRVIVDVDVVLVQLEQENGVLDWRRTRLFRRIVSGMKRMLV
jgi:hypothetical protein